MSGMDILSVASEIYAWSRLAGSAMSLAPRAESVRVRMLVRAEIAPEAR